MKKLLSLLIVVMILVGCRGDELVLPDDVEATLTSPLTSPLSSPQATPEPGEALAAATGEPTPTEVPTGTATPTAIPTAMTTPTATPTATPTSPPTPTPLPTPTPPALRPMVVDIDATEVEGEIDLGRLVLNGSIGGYAPLINYNWLPDAYDELAEVEMEMIRLDHITDDAFYRAVWRDSDGDLRFDFSRLNMVVAPMFDHGMTPLLSLAYKPDVLAPAGKGTRSMPPTDLNEWSDVVEAYVEHFASMGYTGLHWEVWNEPNLDFFFNGTPEQYINLYVVTANTIKEIDPTAKVGGSADSSVTYHRSMLIPLLDYIGDHPEVPLDFVSYHDYADPDGDGLPPYDLGWRVGIVEELMAENGLAPRPIFVTEWHLTPNLTTAGAGAPSDTHVGAAALAVRIYHAVESPALTRLFFFSPIEGYRPERILSGDLGLLTVNYHRKAAHNLFKMISMMGETRLTAQIDGEATADKTSYALATFDGETEATAVLAWNYWDAARTMELAIGQLPYDRNVLVEHYVVDAHHGNYYIDEAAGLHGYPVGPTERLTAVESRVVPATDLYQQRVSLAPYSVTLVVLTPTDRAPTPGPIATPFPELPRNYAAGQPVSASSSKGSGWGPQRLVDEITHSLPSAWGWSSEEVESPTHEAWVQVDLGEPVRVDTIRLYPRDEWGHEGAGFPIDFVLQGATDPNDWTTLVGVTGYRPQDSGKVQRFTFEPGEYRYIRLLATELRLVDEGEYALQLAEMEVLREGTE